MRIMSNVLKGAAGAVLACAVFASSASALSCMRPDIAKKMEDAKASPDLYYILVGRFDTPALPKMKPKPGPGHFLNGRGPHTVQARFTGSILSNDPRGDEPVRNMPVDVAITCGGPWCGGAPGNGQDYIAFVKARDGQPLQLEAGPCGDSVFWLDSKQNDVAKLRGCFDKKCVSDRVDNRY